MKRTSDATAYKPLFSALLVCIFLAGSFTLPANVAALEVTAQTRQLLPPGSSSCAPISASAFTPYIYDGSLHSFEFTIPDASYVALVGSVGESSIPFELMTRQVDTSGAVRIHVDIETTPVGENLSLQVTLVSARAHQPVCLGVISVDLGPGEMAASATETPVTTPTEAVAAVTETVSAPVIDVSSPDVDTAPETTLPPDLVVQEGADAASTASVVSTVQNQLRSLCSSEADAYRLWLILLVLFTVAVGLALWAEFPLSMPWARTPENVATFILVLLLLLLGFWYLSATCRAALWMPLVAFLIALLGLLAAFWNHPRVTQLLLIQDSKGH
ncbi:MAG: hypothetical protein AAB804_01460 [Patescibacteria group bacterium]